jgi:hypothetical protein
MGQGVRRAAVAGLMALTALAGCETAEPVPPPAPEVVDDLPPPPVPPIPEVPEPSEASRLLTQYYARVQADKLAQGRLRGERAPADAPFDAAQLSRDFVRIALFDEYVDNGGTLVADARVSSLRRWAQPVRIGLTVGATVDADQGARDRASLAAYAGRLARVSGHPIRLTDGDANLHVLILTEDDRLAAADTIRALIPGIGEATLRTIINMPRDTYCLAAGFSDGDSPLYAQGLVVIRAEHPDLMRLACIHEEVAQALGLVNDSPTARPSIFNDNEEFGLLTLHDELLLKILYDDRLTPGMSAAVAAPIVRQIASELVDGQS